MLLAILFLIGGIALILIGADKLTDGASSLAAKFNISDIVIGLTVVAFGTSMPEFVISIISAIKGSAELAIGNVVGSNIFNTLMLVGCAAVMAPIAVGKSTVTKDIPFTILASIVLFAMANDILFDNQTTNIINRSEGILLLGFFAVFLTYTLSIAHNQPQDDSQANPPKEMSIGKCLIFIVLGLAGLITGGELFVDGACDIARFLGVSESVIGLTIVAAGTSLPELATTISAAKKQHTGIVIGNAIGSNIFNIFWILGASSCISPLPLGNITNFDLVTLLVSGFILWIFSHTKMKVNRLEGALMIACYVGYITYMVITSTK